MDNVLIANFKEAMGWYTDDVALADNLWLEIQTCYTGKNRFYHTLAHLDNMLAQLSAVKGEIDNWPAVLLALYYHDVVYNPLKSDNEEKSADLAATRLASLSVPTEVTETTVRHILATKKHLASTDNDTNLFIDADLCILGADPESYSAYTQNIRKEYAIYPDFVYNPGRKKVLAHFLDMERIFKTPYFFEKYEQQARRNLMSEF